MPMYSGPGGYRTVRSAQGRPVGPLITESLAAGIRDPRRSAGESVQSMCLSLFVEFGGTPPDLVLCRARTEEAQAVGV